MCTDDSSDQQVVGDAQQALPQLDLRGVLMALAREDYPLLELEVLHQVLAHADTLHMQASQARTKYTRTCPHAQAQTSTRTHAYITAQQCTYESTNTFVHLHSVKIISPFPSRFVCFNGHL